MSTKIQQIKELVSGLSLPELSVFVALFDIQLTVPQLAAVVSDYAQAIKGRIVVRYDASAMGGLREGQTYPIIQLIKVVRYLTGWGLKESKDWVDALKAASVQNGGPATMVLLDGLDFTDASQQIRNSLQSIASDDARHVIGIAIRVEPSR